MPTRAESARDHSFSRDLWAGRCVVTFIAPNCMGTTFPVPESPGEISLSAADLPKNSMSTCISAEMLQSCSTLQKLSSGFSFHYSTTFNDWLNLEKCVLYIILRECLSLERKKTTYQLWVVH